MDQMALRDRPDHLISKYGFGFETIATDRRDGFFVVSRVLRG
jgi:hypothetical protein